MHRSSAQPIGRPPANIDSGDLVDKALRHTLFSLVSRSELDSEGPHVYLSGEGPYVTDQQGRRLLDMLSAATRANSLGYGNRQIAQTMYDQAATMHYSGTCQSLSRPAVELAQTLATLAPGRLSKTCFVSGGSEAVETALKLARQYQHDSGNKPRAYKVISRWNAYHGSTLGALSASDWLAVRDIPDPRAPGHSFVSNPMCYRNPYNMDEESYADLCAAHLERQIQSEGPDLVAAFIGEPIMQAHGVQIPPKRYWQRVREICDRYGVLLILDEVITGFGRTGHWFAGDHFEVEPDILTMAKAMGAGYAPIGAVMTRDSIADAISLFRHVHTFGAHAVACAVALKVIEIKQEEGLIERARQMGEVFQTTLAAALGDDPIVGDIRGIGLWHAIDFTSDRESKAAFQDDTVAAIARRMREHGVIVGANGSAIEMAPPLIVDETHLEECVDVCAGSIREIRTERGLGE